MSRRLRLAVFDLDGTLWWPEMYMLWGSGGPPFTSLGPAVQDRSGTKVELMRDSQRILHELSLQSHIIAAISSRTDEPGWAQECMHKIIIDPKRQVSMKKVFQYEEISKENKSRHFHNLSKKTGISFDEMVFFDNEMGNIRDVSRLGVVAIYTPDGLTYELWKKALNQFA